ncbi:uncharacterized protein LOC143419988 [Maylandia zebra]|uniref:uncharacterized protein LOC143419988 n=1 Tax=Maylandia zebra TaxID=106582 RepID=UPI00403D0920
MSDPQAAPPTQPLQFLAQMLAEMATMSRDQAADQRAHLAALQEQTARQTQILERLVGAAATPKPSPLSVAVPRMGDGDDPQIFLETFRATAEACQWPREEWAPRLLPLLSGEAQTAALSLPPASRSSFPDVSRAVVDRLGLTAEDHRRRFRACRLATTDRPFPWARQLRDAAVRWLQPGASEGETKLVDKVVLEQFTEGLPAETARWVRCHRPASLEVAVTLAEDHLAAGAGEPGDAGRRPNKQAPVPAPRRRVPAPGQAERLPALSPTNPFAALVPSRGAERSGAAPEPRRAAQTPGPECWKCGQPGHLRRDCPLMEVGQVFRVAGAPAPSPGPGGTYSIPTDASDRGLGAVLSQQVRGADRPVLYISRKLAERERRYSTVEKECLAIRWAVGSLRYYLLGRSFTLCSDHAPLQWLHRMKDANARITRWYLALQPFKFKVIHRPGAQMAVADFLSRSRGGVGSAGRLPGLERAVGVCGGGVAPGAAAGEECSRRLNRAALRGR